MNSSFVTTVIFHRLYYSDFIWKYHSFRVGPTFLREHWTSPEWYFVLHISTLKISLHTITVHANILFAFIYYVLSCTLPKYCKRFLNIAAKIAGDQPFFSYALAFGMEPGKMMISPFYKHRLAKVEHLPINTIQSHRKQTTLRLLNHSLLTRKIRYSAGLRNSTVSESPSPSAPATKQSNSQIHCC